MVHTVEASLLIAILAILFCINYLQNRKQEETFNGDFYLSTNVSTALKGLMAIVIICHHYCLYRYDLVEHIKYFTFIISQNGGNFSLIGFLFLSGYGVTKSEIARLNAPKSFFKKRIWKILKPFLIIYGITFVVYLFFTPYEITESYIKDNHLNPFLAAISSHKISPGLILNWFCFKMDWYVYTTLIMYVLFYLSSYIIKGNDDVSYSKKISVLVILTVIYYLVCCYIYTPNEAHYYRNLWAFVLGSVMAYKPRLLCSNIIIVLMVFIILMAFNYYREGHLYVLASLGALFVLIILGYTNYRFDINSKSLLYLGGISYYLYLSHRMFYNVLCVTENLSFPLFVVLSIAFAIIYNKLAKIKINVRNNK